MVFIFYFVFYLFTVEFLQMNEVHFAARCVLEDAYMRNEVDFTYATKKEEPKDLAKRFESLSANDCKSRPGFKIFRRNSLKK